LLGSLPPDSDPSVTGAVVLDDAPCWELSRRLCCGPLEGARGDKRRLAGLYQRGSRTAAAALCGGEVAPPGRGRSIGAPAVELGSPAADPWSSS